MKSVNSFCDAIKNESKRKDETNKLGNRVYRGFMPTDRYIIDFADEYKAEGWQQFDTDQDAHYFGVWVNPGTRRTLTYAEGDWSLVECDDNDHYNAEIANAIEVYGEGRIATVIDTERRTYTVYRQDRTAFFIQADGQ